jgi:uncharacterized membrane protein
MKAGAAAAVAALALAVLGTASFVLLTMPSMPERVATHFGSGNLANAWMTRDGYRLYMLIFAVGLPLLVALAIGVVPRWIPGAVDIPNPDYWLRGERLGTALAYLARQACWLGALLSLLGAGVHACIMAANFAQPPRLPALPFVVMLSGFFLALLWWMFSVFRFFSRSGPGLRDRARRAAVRP